MLARDPLTPRRLGPVGSLLLLGLFGVACREAPDPAPLDAGGAAVMMFALAGAGEPSRDQLDDLFDPEMSDRNRAALLDALALVGKTPEVTVEAVESLEGLGRSVVELAAELPGGGRAGFAVHVEPLDPGIWRVRWFRGPGVEWPAAGRRRDEGLTTSAPPPPA